MKREREKKITRLHIILFFFFVIVGVTVFLVIKSKLGGSEELYKELENEIVTATNTYISLKNPDIADGSEQKINITELTKEENNYLQNDLVKECEGYVIISRTKGSNGEYFNEITPYIKCGSKYKTVNYEVYE